MNSPNSRGALVDEGRIDQWVQRFPGYRLEITADRINDWLGQFNIADKDLAARLLDCIEYVSSAQIEVIFIRALSSLPGWSSNPGERTGKWRFVAYSRASGESGDTMLHRFRSANGLAPARFNELFIHRSELLRELLGPDDTVVFLDDFAGTGDQVCNGWRDVMEELLPEQPTTYLLLAASRAEAKKRIEEETMLQVRSGLLLDDHDNIFSGGCTHFDEAEKTTVLRYCKRANRRTPRGWGNCGLLLVLAHKTPNNSIPVLHASHDKWEGLFPR